MPLRRPAAVARIVRAPAADHAPLSSQAQAPAYITYQAPVSATAVASAVVPAWIKTQFSSGQRNAVWSAQQYIDMPFSRSGLIQQLKFEGFTSAQAEYGANAAY